MGRRAHNNRPTGIHAQPIGVTFVAQAWTNRRLTSLDTHKHTSSNPFYSVGGWDAPTLSSSTAARALATARLALDANRGALPARGVLLPRGQRLQLFDHFEHLGVTDAI